MQSTSYSKPGAATGAFITQVDIDHTSKRPKSAGANRLTGPFCAEGPQEDATVWVNAIVFTLATLCTCIFCIDLLVKNDHSLSSAWYPADAAAGTDAWRKNEYGDTDFVGIYAWVATVLSLVTWLASMVYYGLVESPGEQGTTPLFASFVCGASATVLSALLMLQSWILGNSATTSAAVQNRHMSIDWLLPTAIILQSFSLAAMFATPISGNTHRVTKRA